MSSVENSATDKEEITREINEKRAQSMPILQAMADSADKGDVKAYFSSYHDILKLWTPPETLEEGQIVPPWYVPGGDIQLIMIHTSLSLAMHIMSTAGVFHAAAMAEAAKKASGLVSARGTPIIRPGG